MGVSPLYFTASKSPVTYVGVFGNIGTKSGYLISGDSQGSIRFWSLITWKLIQVLSQPFDQPNAHILWFTMTEKTDILIVQCRFNGVKTFAAVSFWEEGISQPALSSVLQHQGFCKGHHLTSPINLISSYIAFPSSESDIIVFEEIEGSFKKVAHLKMSSSGMIMSIRLVTYCTGGGAAPIIPKVMAVYENGDVVLWDCNTASIIEKFSLSLRQGLADDVFTPMTMDFDGEFGVIAGSSDVIVLFSFNMEKSQFEQIGTRSLPTKGVSQILIRRSTDNIVQPLLAAACWDWTVRLFSWPPIQHQRKFCIKALGALKFHRESVDCLAFSDFNVRQLGSPLYLGIPQEYPIFLLAGGSRDGKVSLWDVYNNF